MIKLTNKEISVLMLDKSYIQKQLDKDLPGVPGATTSEEKDALKKKEDLPGLSGVKEKSKSYSEDYMKGYAKGLKESMGKNDDDDDDDDDECSNMKSNSLVKKMTSIVKKMFSSNSITPLYSNLYSENNGISMINIDGVLGKKLSEEDKENGMVDVNDITDALKMAASSETQYTILHINSPGGGSLGIEELGECIKSLSEVKPVFTFCDTVCASAAFWLASCTNGIYCTPSSQLGSIGVYAKVVDYSESLKQAGINVQVFSAGDMKTMGQGEKPLTKEEADYIQKDINEQWESFKKVITDNRGSVDEANMQGQLFSGEKAVSANLADEVIPDLDHLMVGLSS